MKTKPEHWMSSCKMWHEMLKLRCEIIPITGFQRNGEKKKTKKEKEKETNSTGPRSSLLKVYLLVYGEEPAGYLCAQVGQISQRWKETWAQILSLSIPRTPLPPILLAGAKFTFLESLVPFSSPNLLECRHSGQVKVWRGGKVPPDFAAYWGPQTNTYTIGQQGRRVAKCPQGSNAASPLDAKKTASEMYFQHESGMWTWIEAENRGVWAPACSVACV